MFRALKRGAAKVNLAPEGELLTTMQATQTATLLRHDWSIDEIRDMYHLPITELLFRAQSTHRFFHDATKVQMCTLLSIKTGGCPEDCAYCPQSAHYATGVAKEKLLDVATVRKSARAAQAQGSTRFCMGAAWRHVRDGAEFERVLEMVEAVAELGMEVCCTLGMLTLEQAKRLRRAGLKAYNHNLDTGPEYYDRIVSTREYADRLTTLDHVRRAGISVCCGGILGMGESVDDRLSLLQTLAAQTPHPESVPVNTLVPIPGTPLADAPQTDGIELVRMFASARMMRPKGRIRVRAARQTKCDE